MTTMLLLLVLMMMMNMQDADLAAAPITVSEDRRAAVDFSVPFMTFGSEILMKKPLAPNEASTQIPPLPTITCISDLAHQTVIKYGVISDGRTADFFRKSTDPAYKVMWDEMSNNRDYGMVPSTESGVERVRQSDGRYAFITEGTTANYWVHQQPCDLVSVEGKMDTRHYALAVRRGSELKAKLDDALTQMKDDGELDQLHQKWWVERSECAGATSFTSAGRSLVVIALPTAIIALAFPLLYAAP